MSDSTFFKEVKVGPYTLHLLLQNQHPVVEFDDQSFVSIWLLVQWFPLLSDSAYLTEFAQLSNFLWKGLEFQFIISIDDYQLAYTQQIELEKKFSSDVFPYRLTDYKIFDVSVMHAPRLEEEQLTYFVYQTATGLPYRVLCPFPYESTSTLVHYQILPIKAEILS